MRYLAEERGYHIDVLQLLRRLSAGAVTQMQQSDFAELQQRRSSIASLRSQLLARFQDRHGRQSAAPTLSEIAAGLQGAQRQEALSQTAEVRRLIIQTRVVADRLGNRLSLMHQCLDEVLTGRPSAKTQSYNREGRLQSLPSNRSLLTRRG